MSQKKKARSSRLKVPEFMRASVGEGLENIKHRDCCWLGENEEPDEILSIDCPNLEVRDLDDAIEIAQAQGILRRSGALGAETALKVNIKRDSHKRGPKELIDDYMICAIAARYHKEFFENSVRIHELDPIIRDVIEEFGRVGEIQHHSVDALLARLRRKFKKQKDGLLRAVGAEDLPERGPALARARRELDDLEDAGVEIDRSLLDPALRRRGKRV